MSRPDYLSLLGFTKEWLRWGLLSEQSLEALGREYEAGDDKNAEHYRYRAFRDYLASHRPIPPSVADALYRLGEKDPEPAMGRAMMADVVGLPELFERCLLWPDPVLHRALVGRPEMSRQQLERLAESGANRAVRNLATSRLRSKQ